MRLRTLFLAVSSTFGTISAFSPASPALTVRVGSPSSSSTVVPLPRSLPIVQSAKVLPVAYTSASVFLVYRATKISSKVDMAVLVATAALTFFNLGPTDNARLASAKKADKNTPPASSGKSKQLRQTAKTWRSAVNIKLIGQLLGLARMASAKTGFGVMRGAAIIMGANMAFFLCGGGGAVHDKDGAPAPMPANVKTMVLTVDTTLTVAALVAASSPVDSTRRLVSGGIYAVGALIGALEGVANMVSPKK
jgi:hypothetical protein